MPKGMGTYGSKVGRPPKKAKYKDGGLTKALSGAKSWAKEALGGKSGAKSWAKEALGGKFEEGEGIDPFSSRDSESVVSELIEEKADQAVIGETPTMNAQERSQTMPDITEYNEGGKVKSKKVDVTDVVKKALKGKKK